MATKPKKATVNTNSATIMNAVRSTADSTYQKSVPVVQADDLGTLKAAGAAILSNPNLKNQFLTNIFNRIGKVIYTNNTFFNPWRFFKAGTLQLGESVEDIFVQMATPHTYDAQEAEKNWIKQEIPDVRATLYTLNYQGFYKQTIRERDLSNAFLSWNGLYDLVERIMRAIYTAANNDEFDAMKYLIALAVQKNSMVIRSINQDPATEAGAVAFIKDYLKVSDLMTLNKTEYNATGVNKTTEHEDQYLIITADMKQNLNVDNLAHMFGPQYATFQGNMVLIDSFASFDQTRLKKLFGDYYEEITPETLAILEKMPCADIGGEFLRVWDKFDEGQEFYNGEGLYKNVWVHTWKIMGVNPFENAVIWYNGATIGSVTGINITTPAGEDASGTQELKQYAFYNYTVKATGKGIFSDEVTATNVPEGVICTYLGNGVFQIGSGIVIASAKNITFKSVQDPTKTKTLLLTVTA